MNKTYYVQTTKFDHDLEFDETVGPWSTFTVKVKAESKKDAYYKWDRYLDENVRDNRSGIGLDYVGGEVDNKALEYCILDQPDPDYEVKYEVK